MIAPHRAPDASGGPLQQLDRRGVAAGEMSGSRVSIKLTDGGGGALPFLGAAGASAAGVLELRRKRVEVVHRRRGESEPGNDGLGQRLGRLLRYLDDLGHVEELVQCRFAQDEERAAQ